MCGIAGFARLAASDDAQRAAIEHMCEAIAHRGPDGGGTIVRDDVALGMRRLAIVDVAHGHQPMTTADGSITLVYNGEVYNAPALRAQLEADGVSFETRSDTEVILRAYERAPEQVEELLVGMWAFAIHDRRRRRLVLSRDRFGIKPLFVARGAQSIAFASELRCFQTLRSRDGFTGAFEIDAAAAQAMLSWSYVPGLSTIYRGVRRLEPGVRTTVDLTNGRETTRRYWTLSPSRDARRVRSLDEACELTDSTFRRAVREHLESDVPIASFLSGGIDSSLVTAYAAEVSSRPITAFAIGFREPRFDESPYARDAAARIGVELRVDILDEGRMRAELADAMLAYDEPFGDSSSIAMFCLARQVARTHKVALSGDGGDEAFAGYAKYQAVRLRNALATAPKLRGRLAGLLAQVPYRTDRSRAWTNVLRLARKTARALRGDDVEAYVSLTQMGGALEHSAQLLRVQDTTVERFVAELEDTYRRTIGTTLQRTQAADLAGPLPNDMLTKVDRASMACHLEARVPFLDHRVVEVGLGLPLPYTIGTRGKRVLRELHQRRFGRRLAQRRKQGFGVPIERWLSSSFAPACDALFDRRRLDELGLFTGAELGDGAWRSWVAKDPVLLWNAFALAVWAETNHGIGRERVRELLHRFEAS